MAQTLSGYLLASCMLAPGIAITCSFHVRAQTWNVHYGRPEEHLVPGEQSRISSERLVSALKARFGERRGTESLRDLYLWMKKEFSSCVGGGRSIGKTTINQRLCARNMSGCHDHGLVFSGVARYLGHPAVMVDAAGLTWAEHFKTGKTSRYSGHVFAEVCVAPRGILVDSTTEDFLA